MAKTSLHAGLALRTILASNEAVTAITDHIYPIVAEKAELPYIVFRRASFEQNPMKSGYPGADTVKMIVDCYSNSYAQSVEMAEAVRVALDAQTLSSDDYTMRSCLLTGSQEAWYDDAYDQELEFTIKI